MGLFRGLTNFFKNTIENIFGAAMEEPTGDWGPVIKEEQAFAAEEFAEILEIMLRSFSPVGNEPYDVEAPYYTTSDSERTGRPNTIYDGWLGNVYASGDVVVVGHDDAERVQWLRGGTEEHPIPSSPEQPLFFWHGDPKRWPDDEPGWRRLSFVSHTGMKPHVADGNISGDVESEFEVLSDHDFVLVALSEAARDYDAEFVIRSKHIALTITESLADMWKAIGDEDFNIG